MKTFFNKRNKLISFFLVFMLLIPYFSASYATKNQNDDKIIIKNISSKLNLDESKIKDKSISDSVLFKNYNPGKSNKDDNSIITMLDKDVFVSSSDTEKNNLRKELKNDFNNDKYILIYGKVKDEGILYDAVDLPVGVISKDNTASDRLIAQGILKKSNGSVYVESFYAAPEADTSKIDDKLDFLIDGCKKSLMYKDKGIDKIEDNKKIALQSVTVDPDYTKVENYDWGDWGKFQTTTYFERCGYSSRVSIWDVKSSNTTRAGYGLYSSSYATVDNLFTTFDVSYWSSSEEVIDHGPTTTNKNNTTTVTLAAQCNSQGVGTAAGQVGWSWQLPDVDCIDLYNPKYQAAWQFDYSKYSNAARYAFKTEPGARFTNTSGQFDIKISNLVYFYDEVLAPLGCSGSKVTTITYCMNDR